jgi:lysophospholipase L1-like esterase
MATPRRRTASFRRSLQPAVWSLWIWLTCSLLAAVAQDQARAPAAPGIGPSNRVIFAGDSITGIGEARDFGFVRVMREALEKTRGITPTLVALGASGQTAGAWLDIEKRSRDQHFSLDVKAPGHDVKDNLDAGADIVVIMLGMNDNLQAAITDDEASVTRWVKSYRQLIAVLRQRTRARTVALATVTMATEDPRAPKNVIMDRMNRALKSLAEEEGCRLLDTSKACWEVLDEGRRIAPDFHVTYDFVHVDAAGNIGIAMAMLQGLGESAAADWVRREKLNPLLAARQREASGKTADHARTPPPAWRVGTGFIYVWKRGEFDEAAAWLPIDDVIEKGQDFTAAMDTGKSNTLVWKDYVPSVNYTGGDSRGSVDFYAVTSPRSFEGGYAARWIRSDRERPVKLSLCTEGFTGDIHLNVWLNGKEEFRGNAPFGSAKAAIVETRLRPGWNTLVFKSCHRSWLWQTSVELLPVGSETLDGLTFSSSPQK